MDLRQGVIWAYRLLLNREPDDETVVTDYARACASAADVRSLFVNCAEFRNMFAYADRPAGVPRFDVDLGQGVLWGYRLLLCREPSEEDVAGQLERVASIRDVQSIFIFSREFEVNDGHGAAKLADNFVLGQFGPFSHEAPPPGCFRDFLGAVTRVNYLPEFHGWKAGTTEGAPGTPTAGIHPLPEWIGTLRSVAEARDRLVAVELGMGWAPWLVTSAVAARRRGITAVRLIGVEGSEGHLRFAEQHLRDNGLDPEAHVLMHAVVGCSDGIARFPRLDDPRADYGARAAFDGAPTQSDGWIETKSVTLATLLKDEPLVDLLHSDIQGAEADVVAQSLPLLNQRVRRLIIGTHSRQIEGRLFALLGDAGWILEHEQPCDIGQSEDGQFRIRADGEQIWRNANLSH